MKRNCPFLSVIVIGHNESENILRNASSLNFESIAFETIYVDSNSSDSSVEIAKKYFDIVATISNSVFLCAAMGRHIGAQLAKGAWLLFLDADMTLEKPMQKWIEINLFCQSKDEVFYGRMNHFDSVKKRTKPSSTNNSDSLMSSKQFGGAVLVSKELLLKAGNWNYKVFSNEELELAVRLRMNGGILHFINLNFVTHHSPIYRASQNFLNLFNFKSKKHKGFGQILRTNLDVRFRISFFKQYPLLFITAIVNTLISFALLSGLYVFASIAFSSLIILFLFTKNVKFYIIYTSLIFQLLSGYLGEICDTIPNFKIVKTKKHDIANCEVLERELIYYESNIIAVPTSKHPS